MKRSGLQQNSPVILRRDQTVAFRMRQAFRARNLPKRVEPKFLPPPVAAPTSQAVPDSRPVGIRGRHASPIEFADYQGLPEKYIKSLLEQVKLTHMKLPSGEIRILVAQADKEIDALHVKGTPTRLTVDAAA